MPDRIDGLAFFERSDFMRIQDMIMAVKNDFGTEINMLLTYQDYLSTYVFPVANTKEQVATMVENILLTKDSKTAWGEHYWSTNLNITAKFCKNEDELFGFLRGNFANNKEWKFDEEHSSKECLNALTERNIKTNGAVTDSSYHYEKGKRIFEQGEILHNFNGLDYRVMERYSNSNYLLMNLKSGQFLVACDLSIYARYPKNTEQTIENAEHGVEWGHGRYLTETPSEIDFKALKVEYCQPYQQKGKEFQIEIREILSRVENIKADNLGDAIDQAMELYDESKIVLDAEDYKGVDYIPVSEEDKSR